jgi:S-adenosylmethionine:tRNA-ribosyltransferase-isomerase (queuine synthetase)
LKVLIKFRLSTLSVSLNLSAFMNFTSASSFNNPESADTFGEEISLEKAVAWTGTYQENHSGGLRAAFFSATVFQQLLKQYGTTGIRIYNATNSEGQDCFVLVGATEDGDLTKGLIFDKGNVCPNACVTSVLNHS